MDHVKQEQTHFQQKQTLHQSTNSNESQTASLLTTQSIEKKDLKEHQKQMMDQAIAQGRVLLSKSEWLPAAKELSKGVMAFQQMLRTIDLSKAESKAMIKEILRQSVLPTYCNLSLAYYQLGDFTMSKQFAQNVLERDPDHAKALYRKGKSCLSLNCPDQAEQCFKKAQRLDSTCDWTPLLASCISLRRRLSKQQHAFAKRLISTSHPSPSFLRKVFSCFKSVLKRNPISWVRSWIKK